ncbi:hypothetical protein I6A60_01810 [Frankia sp. AgB1.9]|uniref:hypothetical protein n=1 Tax=unclassified Frankia TaxID=2632575 RepID=UPI001932D668|nr:MULTISPECIES: hypothetical protein [unclassified Frankia]MBL7494449.1 hypothetical protein [Frankia sp. AgW1.1]MBL7546621.1 hypothetical protein [Frankia sp. AgB1.9]MBL7622393.1 hypothetical protein [Frankia sp. AgB1.8]
MGTEITTIDALSKRLGEVERRLATVERTDNVLAGALLPFAMSPLLGASTWKSLEQLHTAVKAWLDARASLGPEHEDDPHG